jgi:hypothetical protein
MDELDTACIQIEVSDALLTLIVDQVSPHNKIVGRSFNYKSQFQDWPEAVSTNQ